DVASADCRPAGSRALRVSRTARARRVAALGQVAGTGGGTADGAGRHERVGRTVVAHPVAALRHVADVGCRAADRRALGVRGTGRTRAVAVLLEVADARRGPTRGAGGGEGVGGTVVGDAVAALVDVADVGRGAADGRALRVCGTGCARPVAVLFEVADARRGSTRGAGGDEGVGRTVVADAVTALVYVTDARRGPADGRALGVRGTARARPGAGFREVTDAGCGATRRAGGDEAVGGTVVADAVAALRHVADARRRTTDRRALRICRAGSARARAGLLQVADTGGGTTDGSGGLELAARGAAIPVRHVPIVALLGGLDGAVAAHGCGEGHDGRCPVVAAGGARPVGQVSPGHGHLAEFGLDRDVCVRGAGRAWRGDGYQGV